MPFKPGVSGNPRGRPPGGLSLAARIRALGGEDGAIYVELLHRVALDEGEPTRVRLDALRTLLDRGYGAAPQELHVETSQQMMRASELREALREEGLLTAPPQPAETQRPDLERWLNGDLNSTDSPV